MKALDETSLFSNLMFKPSLKFVIIFYNYEFSKIFKYLVSHQSGRIYECLNKNEKLLKV
jgi:hypothetical protein